MHGLAPWPVEAGPEFVHGSRSKFSEVVKDFGLDFVEKNWPDYWYFGKERQLVNDEQVDDEVDKVCATASYRTVAGSYTPCVCCAMLLCMLLMQTA